MYVLNGRYVHDRNVIVDKWSATFKENIFYVDIEEVGVSDYYDYEGEPETETYNMTFTRNGNKVQLTGDKNITGTLNDSMDEIDFDEIGTVYRQ